MNLHTRVKDFINSENLLLPSNTFMYSPKRFCSFSIQGNKIVNDLIVLSPVFHEYFNLEVPIKRQQLIAKQAFLEGKELWLKEVRLKGIEKLLEEQGLEVKGKKYFETNRQFDYLVPSYYKRTQAPRITTTGSTFHGMKKELKYLILKKLSSDYQMSFIDFDMSAAHARIAVSLLGNKGPLLKEAIVSKAFWDERAKLYKEKFFNQENFYYEGRKQVFNPSEKQIRGLLKVCLYTSLNGGNPISAGRLLQNLKDNCPQLLEPLRNLESIETFTKTELFSIFHESLKKDQLILEVKDLNKMCCNDNGKRVYAIDCVEPYEIDSVHKGISRTLQGFEIILLSLLVKEVLKIGYSRKRLDLIPVSLDHDGLLVMTKSEINVIEVASKLSKGMEEWSSYLFNISFKPNLTLPIEPKFVVKNGHFFDKESNFGD